MFGAAGGYFALSPCLHCAADKGQTAEEIARAKAAECEEGMEKQCYLKILDALKDHLKSHAWLERRTVGTFVPRTGRDLVRVDLLWRPQGLQ